MSDDYIKQIAALEKIAQQRNELLRAFPVICVGALRRLDKGDIMGFSEKVDERQVLLDTLADMDSRSRGIIESLEQGYGTIINELLKPGAENMVCPEWCRSLQPAYAETRKLLSLCRTLDNRLNARAKALQQKISDSLAGVRNLKKVRQGYYMQSSDSKGVYLNCKSD